MKIDLGLEGLQNDESAVSFEELMVDVLESEQQFSDEQVIFDTLDKLTFIRDYVSEYGFNDTIKCMIGDQITYASTEELIEKLDIAIEMMPKVNEFLQQRTSDSVNMENTINTLVEMMSGIDI